MQAPSDNPAGPFEPIPAYDESLKREFVTSLRQASSRLSESVEGLNEAQLDTRYKNWTIRQIVHHIADSHIHSYVRFKWALTENNPTIKAYEEADWVQLEDSSQGDIQPSLLLVEALHTKWVQVIESMKVEQFSRTFVHPQTGAVVSLWEALNYYPWHGRHHTGQIEWLKTNHGW